MDALSRFPTKHSRAEIEWWIDQLSPQIQRTPHVKIIREISALNRGLARMDGRLPHRDKNH